jgi:2-phosphosulfolactate phosphatase
VRLDVFFGAAEITPAEGAGRVVAVIDVLRASTTIAVALANGARAVIPFASSEDAALRAKSFDRSEVRLAGERRMQRVHGFDLGNSPAEFTAEAVEGKTVLLATTNGTPALVGVTGARDVVVAAYVNFTAVTALLRSALRGGTDVSIICAGHDGHFSLEDSACAGRYVRMVTKSLPGVVLNDAAFASALVERQYKDNRERVFADSTHGRALAEAGFEGDLRLAAELDRYAVVPFYRDRQITKLGPDRER